MAKILGLTGSLRAGSFNTRLLQAAQAAVPEGSTLELATLHGIPLYDGDAEARDGTPAAVRALKAQLLATDGLLIASPEYNAGVPGVLKNAVDWLSRPTPGLPDVWRQRPVAVLSASPGGFGGLAAQLHWLPVWRSLGVQPWLGGKFALAKAGAAFTADGSLADDATRQQLAGFVQGFAAFVDGLVRA